MKLGAIPHGDGSTSFSVWAPKAKRVDVHVVAPDERWAELEAGEQGYFSNTLPGVGPGARYRYRLDGVRELPDPASRSQPDGVHGPSEVLDLAYRWTDSDYSGVALADYVTYELHVGTFTEEGSFDAVIGELDRLRALGITAIEIMPVAQFPGARNWGYDGVYPFAVQNSYGAARGLQRLSDACHARHMALVLDVVYNHLGPEGNYLSDYGFYFTDTYRTPWGPALNFDGRHSDEVRRFFIENALQWFEDFHVDALRLDAVHAILDRSAIAFLEELAARVRTAAVAQGRPAYLIAESDANDPRLIRSREAGGYELDALWADDFHHALHALLTGEHQGYYADFGSLERLARAWRDGMAYTGDYSTYRGRRHGRAAPELGPERFVVCAHNHDQIGNRMFGERLAALVDVESRKLAAACALLSPHLPLLFMGEEYGELAPFLYFIDHGDPDLVEAVRRGRREEFQAFHWEEEPPDPASPDTFARSRLDRNLRNQSDHASVERFYAACLALRSHLERGAVDTRWDETARILEVWNRDRPPGETYWIVASFATDSTGWTLMPPVNGMFEKRLSSADPAFGGSGDDVPLRLSGEARVTLPPRSCTVLVGT